MDFVSPVGFKPRGFCFISAGLLDALYSAKCHLDVV